jgi:centriolar protein POC1
VNVEFHPNGTCVGTAMTNNVVKVYDIRMQKLLQHYSSHDGVVNKIAFHPCGNYLLTASNDSTMKV